MVRTRNIASISPQKEWLYCTVVDYDQGSRESFSPGFFNAFGLRLQLFECGKLEVVADYLEKDSMRTGRGLTLVEVIIAVGILAFGMLPIFGLLTESRLVSTHSVKQLKATSMASSIIDGLKRVPADDLLGIQGQEMNDAKLPASFSINEMGVPPAPAGLERTYKILVINKPNLPGERFANPYGRILEIGVTVKETKGRNSGKKVLDLRGYHFLDGTK